MLSYYVRRSSSEKFEKVETPPHENVWIHGDAINEDDLHALAKTYDFNLNILRDVLDKNELPRTEEYRGGIYVFIRTPQRSKTGKVVTTPVLLAIKDNVFINISTATNSDHKLATPSVVAHSTDTMSLLLGTFATVVSEYEDLMQRSAHYIYDTSQRLRTHEVTNEDFVRFVTVEGNLNEYQMNLASMLVVAERLEEMLQSESDQEAVEDILLYVRQLLVAIQSHNQTINSIRSAYGTIANNVLNQRMKTLTVLTLLIALPNLFYGMYGMNVGLPFQKEPWAYEAILGLSGLAVVLVYIIARKRGIF